MTVSVDAIDLKILRALELDARRQNQDIAESIGMSPSACLSRVRRLEQNGVIKRYLTDIDLTVAMPWTEFWCEISLLPVAHGVRLAFEQRLNEIQEIVRVYQLVGHADYTLEIAAPDLSIWTNLLRRLDPEADTISRTTTQLKLRTVKQFAGSPQLLVSA